MRVNYSAALHVTYTNGGLPQYFVEPLAAKRHNHAVLFMFNVVKIICYVCPAVSLGCY